MPNPQKPSSIASDGFYDLTVNKVQDVGHTRFRPRNAYRRVRGSIVIELGEAVETAVESEPDPMPPAGEAA